MFLLPLAILLTSAPLDGLAPLRPGVAAAGVVLDLVLRPNPEGCRLLLSDAESDAPVVGAKLSVTRFGPTDHPTIEATAAAGRYEGHYLLDRPEPGETLAVAVARGGLPGDLFVLSAPVVEVAVAEVSRAPSLLPAALGLAVLALLVWRRRARTGRLGALVFALLAAGDARAHGGDAAGLPVAPGTEVKLAQEIQFALGLRTARVEPATFLPPQASDQAAPRTYPSAMRSAVVERDGKKLIFIRVAPELFVAREVTLGWSNGQNVAVEAGVQPGELAVVSGAGFLRNGGAALP